MSANLRGIALAAVGTAIGLYLGALVGGLIGNGVGSLLDTGGGGLETLGPVALGVVLGGVVGASAICWAGLRAVRAAAAGATALLLIPVLIFLFVAAQLAAAGAVTSALGFVPAALGLAAGAVARLLAGALRRGQG